MSVYISYISHHLNLGYINDVSIDISHYYLIIFLLLNWFFFLWKYVGCRKILSKIPLHRKRKKMSLWKCNSIILLNSLTPTPPIFAECVHQLLLCNIFKLSLACNLMKYKSIFSRGIPLQFLLLSNLVSQFTLIYTFASLVRISVPSNSW